MIQIVGGTSLSCQPAPASGLLLGTIRGPATRSRDRLPNTQAWYCTGLGCRLEFNFKESGRIWDECMWLVLLGKEHAAAGML